MLTLPLFRLLVIQDRILKKPDTPLGEARITVVSLDLSTATLLHPEQLEDVQELDKVITT